MRNIKKFLKKKKIISIYIVFFSIISFFFVGINENKFKTQASVRLPNIYITDGASISSLEELIYDIRINDIWFIKNLDIKIEEKFNIPKECILIKKFNSNTFAYAKSYSILGLSIGYNRGYNLFIEPESGFLLINFISHNKDLNEMCVNTLIYALDDYLNDRTIDILSQIKIGSWSKELKKFHFNNEKDIVPVIVNYFQIIKPTQSFSIRESKIFYFFIYFCLIFLLSIIFFLLKSKKIFFLRNL
jgi:hypothetical protein